MCYICKRKVFKTLCKVKLDVNKVIWNTIEYIRCVIICKRKVFKTLCKGKLDVNKVICNIIEYIRCVISVCGEI